uniref:Ig-like domain-containing protein n=1 Tax=Strigamia maritima TaxID=126957 RepID=T1JKS2_STRMM
ASPAFHSTFQEEIIEAGTPVSLHCAASGNPTAEISWTLDGSSIPVNRRFHIGAFVSVSSDVISYINISTSRVEDGGQYSCTAVNDLGKTTHSARLNVRGLPYIRQMTNQTIVAGTDFNIRCPASGYPIHSITWEKEGSLLPAALHQTVYANGTLVVNKVQRTDAGTYTCIAKNNKGLTARKTLWVSVL